MPAKCWRKLDARVELFWYRQSPRALGVSELAAGNTSPDNSPLRHAGEILIMLDAEEHLVFLRCMPAEQAKTETGPALDWAPFFAEAGLDISQWTRTDPQRMPPSYADSRFAWQGLLPGRPGTPARIEAASFHGKPVSFEIIDPWAPAAQLGSTMERLRQDSTAVLIILVPAIACGIFFARRNLRLGRGDRRSATRLALFSLSALALWWALNLPHFALSFLSNVAAYGPILFWILYVAIEPYMRRKWPQVLISWTRLWSGEWRDPMVAGETLVGIAFGIILACVSTYRNFLPSRFLSGIDNVVSYDLTYLLGTRFLISTLLGNLLFHILMGLAMLCLVVVLSALLRSQKAAIAVSFLLMAVPVGITAGFPHGLAYSTLWLLALMRFGLIASILTMFINQVFGKLAPVTLHTSAWYAPDGYLVLAILAVIVLYAFRYSLGGRPLLAGSRLDD